MSLELVELGERDKYRRMWERKEYRRYSPGLEAAPDAFKHMRQGESLYDLGCGTGRAGEWFSKRCMNVVLVDFAPNAVEVQLPFVEACLWDMNLPKSDWGFCADVMEHIPPQHVDDALRCIALCCKRAYLQIHCDHDGCGKLIGEKLHLTVQSPDMWAKTVARFFKIEHKSGGGRTSRVTFVVSEKEAA